MSVEIEGTDELIRNLRRLGDAGERHGAKAIRATAEKVRTDAARAIQKGPATGRVYERGANNNLSGAHQASAPGQAPMTDTGNLAGSGKASHRGLSGDVTFSAPYAVYLEYGTLRMAERPFLVPALKANTKYLERQLQDAIQRAIREVDRT